MATATMTTKGQVTIPKEIRDALHLQPGDRVDFVLLRDGTALLRPRTGRLEDLFGMIKYDGPPVTTEQMDEGIARHLSEKYGRKRR
jgi:antitoxin PrlF